MRAIIIGAGVIGCTSAIELAKRNVVSEILLLERAVPGAEASSAAAGILAAEIESKHLSQEEKSTFLNARDSYGRWARELRESSGVDIGHRICGALEVAHSDVEWEALVEASKGPQVEMLEPARVYALEPSVCRTIAGALWFPNEAQVDPVELLRALETTIHRAYADRITIRSGTVVSSLRRSEAGRCVGVELDNGEIVSADVVILAAGSWSSLIPGVTREICDVRPMRGQLVMLDQRPAELATILFSRGGYVVPRGDGRIICGSTMEDVGHRRESTAGGIHSILSLSLEVAPSLAAAPLIRTWCNFRPFAPRPYVGESVVPGLVLATGHHRNGILLAKEAGEKVATAVLASS